MRRLVTVVALALALLVLTACGGCSISLHFSLVSAPKQESGEQRGNSLLSIFGQGQK